MVADGPMMGPRRMEEIRESMGRVMINNVPMSGG